MVITGLALGYGMSIFWGPRLGALVTQVMRFGFPMPMPFGETFGIVRNLAMGRMASWGVPLERAFRASQKMGITAGASQWRADYREAFEGGQAMNIFANWDLDEPLAPDMFFDTGVAFPEVRGFKMVNYFHTVTVRWKDEQGMLFSHEFEVTTDSILTPRQVMEETFARLETEDWRMSLEAYGEYWEIDSVKYVRTRHRAGMPW